MYVGLCLNQTCIRKTRARITNLLVHDENKVPVILKRSVLSYVIRVQLLVSFQVGYGRRKTTLASLDFCHSRLICYVNGSKHVRQTFFTH
jgi:hypothetical protein